MPSSSTRKPKTVRLDKLFELMDRWPQSWAGSAADIPVGEGLVAEIRPFIQHLADSGLSPKTVRRHLDNAWVIGGEIIRQIVWEPERRDDNPRQILLDAIDLGEAPLVQPFSEQEQRSLDATAKKLFRFLSGDLP
jgi:hypothetical protein